MRAAIISNVEKVICYPDPKAQHLREAIASFYNVPQENIILANGATELFYCFFYTIRPRRVLLPVPSFSEYERAAKAAGADVSYFLLNRQQGFSFDVKKALVQLAAFDAVILCSPNNPTGGLLLKEELCELIKRAEAFGVWVVVDESFLDFCKDREEYTVRHLTKKYRHLLVVQSMTKIFALPGLRLGFGVAEAAICRLLEMGKDVWNVNVLAQMAGIAALFDVKYQDESRHIIQKEQAFLVSELKKLPGVEIFTPTANFIFFRLRQGKVFLQRLFMYLRKKGILLRDCSNYVGLEGAYLRIAVRLRTENEHLLREMQAFWKECSTL